MMDILAREPLLYCTISQFTFLVSKQTTMYLSCLPQISMPEFHHLKQHALLLNMMLKIDLY